MPVRQYTATFMNSKSIHTVLNFCIAAVWMINGLFCKVLDLVPRHQLIVAKILGNEHARLLTIFIGVSEICMAIWIVSNVTSGFNAIVQILIIATMNTLEVILVPGMLLWGKANAIFAFILILVICFNEFHLNRKLTQQS